MRPDDDHPESSDTTARTRSELSEALESAQERGKPRVLTPKDPLFFWAVTNPKFMRSFEAFVEKNKPQQR